MSSHKIAVSADTALSHASKLHQANDTVPDGNRVYGSYRGATEQVDEAAFSQWLDERADIIALAADELINAVSTNAEALKLAAQDLLERDVISSQVAQNFDDAIDMSAWAAQDAASVTPAGQQTGTTPVPVKGSGSGGDTYATGNTSGTKH